MLQIDPASERISGLNTSQTLSVNGVDGLFFSMLQNQSTGSLDAVFSQAAQKYHVPENLLRAVAKAESNFDPDAVSSCGAMGIMQLMPSTAESLGVTDAFNPVQNINGGAKLLSSLLNQYDGDYKLTLAAYNAGSGNVEKYGGVPPFQETQNYVNRVLEYLTGNLEAPDIQITNSNEGFTYIDYRKFAEIFLSLYMAAQNQSTNLAASGMYFLG